MCLTAISLTFAGLIPTLENISAPVGKLMKRVLSSRNGVVGVVADGGILGIDTVYKLSQKGHWELVGTLGPDEQCIGLVDTARGVEIVKWRIGLSVGGGYSGSLPRSITSYLAADESSMVALYAQSRLEFYELSSNNRIVKSLDIIALAGNRGIPDSLCVDLQERRAGLVWNLKMNIAIQIVDLRTGRAGLTQEFPVVDVCAETTVLDGNMMYAQAKAQDGALLQFDLKAKSVRRTALKGSGYWYRGMVKSMGRCYVLSKDKKQLIVVPVDSLR